MLRMRKQSIPGRFSLPLGLGTGTRLVYIPELWLNNIHVLPAKVVSLIA